jgi:rare lipoprotein A (peptidoglycan hydrolase)
MVTELLTKSCAIPAETQDLSDIIILRPSVGTRKSVSKASILLLSILLAACGNRNVQSSDYSAYRSQTEVGSKTRDSQKRESRFSSHVVASWYGPGYEGRRTASGETFDPNDFSAASRTLPLGSIVRVTNIQNGRSVIVRINDRGPVTPGRSIDLSPPAARKIGLTNKGIDRVKITRIRG